MDISLAKILQTISTKYIYIYPVSLFLGGVFVSLLLSKYVFSKKEICVDSEGVGGYIFADISGAVNKPGVYQLPDSSLVVDLLKQGEGIQTQVSKEWVSKNLNLSSKLEDGQKVYVPFEWDIINEEIYDIIPLEFDIPETTPLEEPSTKTGKLNVNKATMEELDGLPGIGPTYAQKIVDNRPYADFESLKEKSGVKASTLEDIKKDLVYE
ncbi:helix-hairpin-helix domain-containing protein [Patescibacteria group bacterium]